MLGWKRLENDGACKILSFVDISVSVYVKSSEFASLLVEPLLTEVLRAGVPQIIAFWFWILKYLPRLHWSKIPHGELHSGAA